VPYVAGVSKVRVKARVGSTDPVSGTLTIGGLVVDYTNQLSLNPTLAPVAGDVVEVAGVQPLANGTVFVGATAGGLVVEAATSSADAGRR
jgi:hypothetical protein